MKQLHFVSLVLAGAMLAGCGKSKENGPAKPVAPAPSTLAVTRPATAPIAPLVTPAATRAATGPGVAIATRPASRRAKPAATRAAEDNPDQPASEQGILTDVVQLTHGLPQVRDAHFSKDMQWIIFQSPKPGATANFGPLPEQVYVAKLQWAGEKLTGAGEPAQISPDATFNCSGCFSPDGAWLIFASNAKVAATGANAATAPAAGSAAVVAARAATAPAGMQIFRCDDWKAAVDAAGPGGKAKLTLKPLTTEGDHAECSISPDGNWICYTVRTKGNGNPWSDIFVMHADGAEPLRLTTASGDSVWPAFSPGGRRLLYGAERNNSPSLRVATGALGFDDDNKLIVRMYDEHLLTSGGDQASSAAWYPGDNGKHIIYSTNRYAPDDKKTGHFFDLCLMREDGAAKTRITFSNGADEFPAFSSDGKYLLWTSKRGDDHTPQLFAAKFTVPKGS